MLTDSFIGWIWPFHSDGFYGRRDVTLNAFRLWVDPGATTFVNKVLFLVLICFAELWYCAWTDFEKLQRLRLNSSVVRIFDPISTWQYGKSDSYIKSIFLLRFWKLSYMPNTSFNIQISTVCVLLWFFIVLEPFDTWSLTDRVIQERLLLSGRCDLWPPNFSYSFDMINASDG